MSPPTVAVIGLGKVGLPLAAALATRGVQVQGFDPQANRRALLRSHDPAQADIRHERGLSDALISAESRLHAADSIASAVAAADFAFVIVPTPSQADGHFSPEAVEAALAAIGEAPDRRGGLVVSVVSTVSPGTTRSRLQPLLERHANQYCGEGISLCYSPALIALGNVLDGFLKPDFAFVGEVDTVGADRLERFFADTFISGVPLRRMSAESVEVAKIALNNFLTTKISFANLIGQLCETIRGADAAAVLGALGQDSRIGPKCLAPGLGFGGPCLPRDTAALAASLAGAGLHGSLPETVGVLNEQHTDFLAQIDGPVDGRSVTVLGLAYKAGSNVTIDSAAVALCNRLAELGASVTAMDPSTRAMDLSALDAGIRVVSEPGADIMDCDLLLATGTVDLPAEAWELLPARATIIDLGGRVQPVHGRTIRRFGGRLR